tara:strand:- start:404 stop:670 length:267 start_codon:yes stop_codon:yes gene_type:complete
MFVLSLWSDKPPIEVSLHLKLVTLLSPRVNSLFTLTAECPAPYPIAVLSSPVVIVLSAYAPTAVFLRPEVTLNPALFPMCVFSSETDL